MPQDQGAGGVPPELTVPGIPNELWAMSHRDQEARKDRSGESFPDIDREYTERLHTMVDEIGRPTISRVGEIAANSAWLLIQHADHDPQFQRRCLELMRAAGDDVDLRNLGYLEDRVRVNAGEPQLYGTQDYTDETGAFGPRPIEDPAGLDARRATLGMEPMAEYDELIRGFHEHPERWNET